MLPTAKLLADKRFPKKITRHPIFKKYKHIKKIFPEIGLANCSTDYTLSSVDNQALLRTVNELLADIHDELGDRHSSLSDFQSHIKTSERLKKYHHLEKILTTLLSIFNTHPYTNFHHIGADGKFSLHLPNNVNDDTGKPIFKKGMGLFKVYNQINRLLLDGKFKRLTLLETFNSFKSFSSLNINSSGAKLVFSSDGIDGAWDITTMSMRGISSCQRWDADRSSRLVGSIIDPFTGIIYITNGYSSDEYGTTMLRRCIVRFIIRAENKQPALLLERMYPAFDSAVNDAFVDFLTKKTNNKFPILTSTEGKKYYIPCSAPIKKLAGCYRPWVDSRLKFKEVPELQARKSAVELDSSKEYWTAFYSKLGKSILSEIRRPENGFYGGQSNIAMLKFLRKKANWSRFQEFFNHQLDALARENIKQEPSETLDETLNYRLKLSQKIDNVCVADLLKKSLKHLNYSSVQDNLLGEFAANGLYGWKLLKAKEKDELNAQLLAISNGAAIKSLLNKVK